MTESKQARAFLDSILKASDAAIIKLTADGRIDSWNRAAEADYGYNAPEVLGRDIIHHFAPELRGAAQACINRVIRDSRIQHFGTRLLRKDGSPAEVSVILSPINDATGTVGAIAIIARDITQGAEIEQELTKARDEAVEAARLKSEFLANMSHEIRTPLNSLVGLTRMLLDTELTEEQRILVRELRDNFDGLLAIINDILDFSKMSAGKLLFNKVNFELQKVVASAIRLVAQRAREKKLEISVAIEPGAPGMVRGDPGRLRQVLANLLSNAVKFTERGDIAIKVMPIGKMPGQALLRFEVRDTGIGIARDAQARLFRPFSQVGAPAQEGTGLGLAIARTLVERMGGEIGVTSAPGTGSIFWFTARLEELQADVTDNPVTGAIAPVLLPDGSKPRVLLAEDNRSNQKVALWQLAKMGCTVDAVSNGIEAVEALARRHYDVVLLDCRMPKMDGYEAARQIRRREGSARHTWIIAMTAHALSADRQKCLEAGMDDYLSKPVGFENLAATLQRVLNGTAAATLSQPDAASTGPIPEPERVLDPDKMASLRAQPELLLNLIQTVAVEIPETLNAITDALAANSQEDAAIAAHSLKGTARIFGAAQMAELAGAVEKSADSGALDQASPQLEHLREECARLNLALQREKVMPIGCNPGALRGKSECL